MLAPSATSLTPALTSASASASSTSFWVAQGSAMSNLASMPHGRLPATYSPPAISPHRVSARYKKVYMVKSTCKPLVYDTRR